MRYATTRWSLIQKVRGGGPEGRRALDELLKVYGDVIESYFRKRAQGVLNKGGADIDDLRQEFIAEIIQRGIVDAADESKGKFRSYLKTAMDRFLSKKYRDATAEKRGGKIDVSQGATESVTVLSSARGPDEQYEAEFAAATVLHALGELEKEATAKGRFDLFMALRPTLLDGADHRGDKAIGSVFGMKPNAVAVARNKLKKRLRDQIRKDLSDLVAHDVDIDEELEVVTKHVSW